MILTGKAKENFTKNFWNKVDFSHKLNTIDRWYESFQNHTEEVHQYASVIDWLDSVGIYVDVQPWPELESDGTYVKTMFLLQMYDVRSGEAVRPDDENEDNIFYPSRHEATEAAIKLANDLYNGNK